MTNKKKHDHYQTSLEEIAKHWTLSSGDKLELSQYRKSYRLFVATQLCSVRLYGRFLFNAHELSAEVINYLSQQLNLPPTLLIKTPMRKATLSEQRQNILTYLGFQKFEGSMVLKFQKWIEGQAKQGALPDALIPEAQRYLLDHKVILPGLSVIERTIINLCNKAYAKIFEAIYQKLTPDLRKEISKLMEINKDEQKSYFSQLKEYPPSAKANSIKLFLARYERLKKIDLEDFDHHFVEHDFVEYSHSNNKPYELMISSRGVAGGA